MRHEHQVRRRGHVRGHLVQAELVALDVLHHQARLVAVIGRQQPHPDRAERDQPGAFGLKRGQPPLTRQPDAGPHVKMQPVLDDPCLREPAGRTAAARTAGIGARER